MTDTPASGGHPWLHRLGLYVRLVRLHKPIGILLLVWPTLWALFVASLAGRQPIPCSLSVWAPC